MAVLEFTLHTPHLIFYIFHLHLFLLDSPLHASWSVFNQIKKNRFNLPNAAIVSLLHYWSRPSDKALLVSLSYFFLYHFFSYPSTPTIFLPLLPSSSSSSSYCCPFPCHTIAVTVTVTVTITIIQFPKYFYFAITSFKLFQAFQCEDQPDSQIYYSPVPIVVYFHIIFFKTQ